MTALPFRTGEGELRLVPASTTGQTRLQRLVQQHARAQGYEVNADPCSPEREAWGEQADRIIREIRLERLAQVRGRAARVWGGLV